MQTKDFVRTMSTREDFYSTMTAMLAQMSAALPLPDAIKDEVLWQFDGMYERLLDTAVERADAIYTSEEMQELYDLYQRHPQLRGKDQQFGIAMMQAGMALGQEVDAIVRRNLEETGEWDKLVGGNLPGDEWKNA